MHQLGDRVLDLEPGVHLQEAEPLGRRVVEELDRAGAAVVDRLGRLAGGVVERGAHLVAQARAPAPPRPPSGAGAAASSPGRRRRWCRRPGPRRAGRARRTARRRRCRRRTPTRASASRLRDLAGQVGERADDPHAATATTGGRLHQQREVGLGRLVRRLEGRDAGLAHDPLGLDLRAHRVDRLGRRTDPGQPGVDRPRGRSRRSRRGTRSPGGSRRHRTAGRVEHQVGAQVGLGRRVAGQAYGDVGLADVRQLGVGVGVDRHRLDAERAAGAEDPATRSRPGWRRAVG